MWWVCYRCRLLNEAKRRTKNNRFRKKVCLSACHCTYLPLYLFTCLSIVLSIRLFLPPSNPSFLRSYVPTLSKCGRRRTLIRSLSYIFFDMVLQRKLNLSRHLVAHELDKLQYFGNWIWELPWQYKVGGCTETWNVKRCFVWFSNRRGNMAQTIKAGVWEFHWSRVSVCVCVCVCVCTRSRLHVIYKQKRP
jgi:hypothetical protein